MKTSKPEKSARRRAGRGWWYAAGLLVIVLIALLVVGTDLRRPPHQPQARVMTMALTDTTLRRWRRNMYNRVRHLEKKYQGYRQRDREYTGRQSRLAGDADSAFQAVYDELLAFDSVSAFPSRVQTARRIKRMFSDLKKPVYGFARSIYVADSVRNAAPKSGKNPVP